MTVTEKSGAAVADDTQTRFMEAAAELFAVHGYEGTKIRAIAKRSNTNLGVLSHYWGSKRALFRDVFEKKFQSIYDQRERRFSALLNERAQGTPITLRKLLEAHIEAIYLVHDTGREDAAQVRVLWGRALTDPSTEVIETVRELFEPQAHIFFGLLQELCPHLDQTEFYWRTNCLVGAFCFAETYTYRLKKFVDEDLSEIDWKAAADYVVSFLEAGMSAPATPATT